MKQKTTLVLAFLLVSILLVSFAWGYDVPDDWQIKYINVEQVFIPSIDFDPNGEPVQIFNVGDGIEDNWGIARITSIIDRATNTVVWSDGDNGEYLSAMFGGLDIYQITAIDISSPPDGIPDKFKLSLRTATTTPEGFPVTAAFLDVYLENEDDLDFAGGPGDRTAFDQYTDFTDGVKQGRFLFRPGIIDEAGSQAFTQADLDSITDPLTGDGAGYLDAVPGSGPFADQVNTDGFIFFNFPQADVFLQFDVRPHPDTGLPDYGWTVNSEDPVIGTKVEEVLGNCRVTAGGNKDGVFCPLLPNGEPDDTFCNVDPLSDDITHTWGGQAGAPPIVDGNWTHKYLDARTRPHNKFTFHSNDVQFIQCSDFGEFCQPARFAPARQIDFAGIGRFTNGKGIFRDYPDLGPLCYTVHLEDIGEPGPGGRWPNATDPCTHCPGTEIIEPDCTNCTDYYEIKIYSGGDPTTGDCAGGILIWKNGGSGPPFDTCVEGEAFVAPFAPYEGFFVRAGNAQIHPDNNGP